MTAPRKRLSAPPPAIGPRVRELRERFHGEVVLPGDRDYDTLRRVWNPGVDRLPLAVARCTSTADVVAAIGFARDAGVAVSVRGGGHSYPGFAVWDDALMVDLSLLKRLTIEPASRRAIAQPGLIWGELDAAAQAFGLATTGADIPSVGIAGMTLGGGLGWLHRMHGLTCDNLVSAEVVLADGRVVRAAEDENADLFWGLRGGGGNLGVVTSFEYELHPVTQILGGILVHRLEHTVDALHAYRDVCRDAPDELRLSAILVTCPRARSIPQELHGRPVLFLACAYFGAHAEGERLLRPLREFGAPVLDRIRPIRYVDLQHPATPEELHHHSKGELLRILDDRTIEAVVAAVADATAAFTIVLISQLGGAMSRVPADATCYPHRHAEHTFGIHSMWDPSGDGERHVEWVEAVWRSALHVSAGGPYVNQLGFEGERRIRAAYGATYERLASVKAKYDPDNVFRINQNVEPRRGSS
ncbi:MAG TPA: FAD-binding oxidoreductase [Gaiellaceae bacterium]